MSKKNEQAAIQVLLKRRRAEMERLGGLVQQHIRDIWSDARQIDSDFRNAGPEGVKGKWILHRATCLSETLAALETAKAGLRELEGLIEG